MNNNFTFYVHLSFLWMHIYLVHQWSNMQFDILSCRLKDVLANVTCILSTLLIFINRNPKPWKPQFLIIVHDPILIIIPYIRSVTLNDS